MKIIKIMFVIIFLFIQYAYSSEDSKSYKVISKHDYTIRIYTFFGTQDCSICLLNLNAFYNYSLNKKIEFVSFVSGLEQADAEELKKQNEWQCKVIGDVSDIYKEHFDITNMPAVIILNGKGQLLMKGKLGSPDLNVNQIDSLYKLYSVVTKNKNSNLDEISRFQVTENGLKHFTNHLREVLFVKSRNQYIIREKALANFFISDSIGKIFRNIKQTANPLLKGYKSTPQLSWKIKDSILCFTNNGFTKTNFIKILHEYDIVKDTFITSKNISVVNDISQEKYLNYFLYLTGDNRFIMQVYMKMGEDKKMEKLSNDRKALVFFDDSLNLVSICGKPADNFINNAAPLWRILEFNLDNNNNIYTIDGKTDYFCKYDKNGKLIYSKEIDLGKEFKEINFDIPLDIPRDSVDYIRSKISFFTALHCNTTKDRILISYFNEDETNPNNKLRDDYFVILDMDGNTITKEPIKATKNSIPFYFEDDYILCSEVNSSSQLEIVKYRIKY